LVHCLIILSLIAVLGMLRQPEQPASTPEEKSAEMKLTSPPVKPDVVEPRLPAQTRTVGRKKTAAPAPKPKIKPRKENPQPSGVYEGLRESRGLSVRGIRLGMTQSETEALYPGPEVVDRIEEYWGPGYPDGARGRFGATWYRYSEFYASFDPDGVCGAVVGDGLNRGGVPILARGDSGADVERLLGKPSYYGRPKSYGRDSGADYCAWRYWFTDDSCLTIRFTDGLVQSFEWRAKNFSDSGC
jgi:hypothetical protein